MSRRSLHTVFVAGVLAASACRPKNTMKPVVFEALDPNSTAASDTAQAPRWGTIRPKRLASKASVLVLDEPGAASLRLRLLVALEPTQAAASTMVAAYTAVDLLRTHLRLLRGQVRLEFGADRLEFFVEGSAANGKEILDALERTFEQTPKNRQFAATRGRLLGELPRPDTTAFAIAGATSAVLERPLKTQLVSPEWLVGLESDEINEAWDRTFSSDRTLLIVHADVARINIGPSIKKFGADWPRKIAFGNLFRGLTNVIDVFHTPGRRERKTKLSLRKSPPRIVSVAPPTGDLKGRPTLVIARLLTLPSTQDRALARLTQRHLQTALDVRLSIEGTKGLWLYRISLDPEQPAASVAREVARIQREVERLPQRWELEQATSLWLGARLVEASLDGDDWTGMASEALSLSEKDTEIATSLGRDAAAMGEISPEVLHEFALGQVLPARDDPEWRWVVVGADDQSVEKMNTTPQP